MKNMMDRKLLLIFCLGAALQNVVGLQKLCSVYDPFKVLPDNNKFQIGGSFPLHGNDCVTLRPETVQEIVAIQWALTHWNQNSLNTNAKIGLYAGDTCSRSREALSQSLRFLDSVGFHEPKECRTEQPGAKLLGLIAPKDYNSSVSLGTMLTVSDLPIAAYSPQSVNALVDLEVENVIATTPTVSVYVEALIRLMGALRSNLVAIVEDGSKPEMVKRVVDQLREADIYVSEILPIDLPLLAQALDDSDSGIVVSILNKKQLFETLRVPSIYTMQKLWISIPSNGEALNEAEQTSILHKLANLEIISLQPRFKDLPQFRDYFLRVLKNNYDSYQLLTAYVQQVYNCSGTDCGLDSNLMLREYSQAKTTEAAIRMTYAYAAVGARISESAEKERVCVHPSSECTQLIINEFLDLDFEFGANDPAEMIGEKLRFHKGKDGVLLVSGMTIDAIELFNDETAGHPVTYRLLSYTTGSPPTVVVSSVRSEDQRLRSVCAPYRPFCGKCNNNNVQNVNSERYFLSIPRHYQMYLAGLFDLHAGASCQSMKNTDISLPMAFVHTVWTFKQRFPQLSVLNNLDFGALLVDSCSSGRQAIESIVRSETQCFRFAQAGRNITIVPGSVFGYISALGGDSLGSLKGYFSSGDSDAALVSVDAEHSGVFEHSYTAMPSAKSQTLALLRFLVRQEWQFVSVALSEQDPESLSLFRQFERLALDRGICIADVINIGASRVDNLPVGTSTNVTVVFATTRDAASYLLLNKRNKRDNIVHVMMGDAHDWHLYIPAKERVNFVGTVSVQPKDILYADFHEWLETTTPLTLPEMWYWAYIEDQYQCALSQKSKLIYGKMCSGDELLNVKTLGRMTKAGYLARGLERFLFAMVSVYKKLCPGQKGICLEFYEQGRRLILNQLKKTNVEDDIEIMEYVEEENQSLSYISIANWSTTTGLRLNSVYRSASGIQISSKCHPPMCKCFLDGNFFNRPLDSFVMPQIDEGADGVSSYIRKQPAFGSDKVAYASMYDHLASGNWRNYPHNFVLLALVAVLVVIAVAVLLLVLVKLYLRVVKGNQSLGISLLVGIILLYITGFFFVFDATDLVCRLRVILHGLSYTICFGVMIAKATQLRNAETLGFGTAVHISFWNYWLLLFFIVGVQIALSTRWMAEPFMSTLTLFDDNHTQMMCSVSREEFVLSNIYVLILLFLALFINSRNRNIKRNYKETKWLFFAAVMCTVIWMVWIPAYFIVPFEYKESLIVCELISCGTVLLAFLFGPKIYILLSYEPVVVEYKPEAVPTQNGLFEKDDDLPSVRAVSPASSTDSNTNRSSATSYSSGKQRTNGGRSAQGTVTTTTSSNYSDEQSPIFHTIMRKKNRVHRSASEHDTLQNNVRPYAGVPVIRSPSSRLDIPGTMTTSRVHDHLHPHHPHHQTVRY
ncbi:hypothetical protein WR25_13296 [Diploscapter pachys]|uniref:G-protein coupled receptors family 3 profile domain-containing protein n=1 Tax=Diploscapter pachys TaxID=2018661 RepID=A0A2A2JRE5_9BILA|nr:hypothetical protein WR25_13296 [Diploscapter pachys]